jgi:phenylacetate-CoA ligase
MNAYELLSWAGFWHRPRSSPAHFRRWRDARVRLLVRHASANVPFYRRRLGNCDEVRGAGDLPSLPLLRKADLFDTPLEDFLTAGTNLPACIVHDSSGTTGEPIHVVRSRAEEYALFAHRLRAQILSGLKPWHLRIKIGWVPVETVPRRVGLFRWGTVSESLSQTEIVERLEESRPDVLYTHPGMFELLLANHHEAYLRALRPKLLFSGAEPLPQSLRARLEEVFECPLVDFYGAAEVNLIAWECRACRCYHTCDDGVLVEVLRDDGSEAGPGEFGRLVVTALHSFTMPFIRYEIGDVVRRPEKASDCETRFGCIDRIAGRMSEYMLLPNGQWLTPYRLEEAIEGVPGIRRFQAVQTAPGEIVFRVQAAPAFNGGSMERLRVNFTSLLPAEVQVNIRVVDNIPLTPAGKHRVVQAWRPEGSGAQVTVAPAGENRQ